MRAVLVSIALAACGGGGTARPDGPPAPRSTAHSSSIAVSGDGATIYVVNADSDSVSILDARGRALIAEIALGSAPAVDATGRFWPAVMPRALALSPDGATLYVTGERSSRLYSIDLATRRVAGSVVVGSEPTGVVVAPDGAAVYVACSNDG